MAVVVLPLHRLAEGREPLEHPGGGAAAAARPVPRVLVALVGSLAMGRLVPQMNLGELGLVGLVGALHRPDVPLVRKVELLHTMK